MTSVCLQILMNFKCLEEYEIDVKGEIHQYLFLEEIYLIMIGKWKKISTCV